MKVLVLAVDRDDDLGRKTGLRGPIVGRSEVLEAAKTLALADPEESDANGMFAAVHEYDKIASDPAEYGASGVEVAIITGNIRVGSRSDAVLSAQFDDVLSRTEVDQILLVSDGAEDEAIMPILSSRKRIAGVRRVVIKQAKNLEGFVYLMVRLMHDEKMQKRFFIPLAFLLFAAAASILLDQPGLFLSAALALTGLLILIQVFGWEEPLGDLMSTLGREIRGGKLSLLASFVSLVLIILGGWLTISSDQVKGAPTQQEYAVFFASGVYWWVMTAVLVTVIGRAMDVWARDKRAPARHVEGILFFLSGAVLGWAVLLGLQTWYRAEAVRSLPLLLISTYVFFAGFLFFAGLIAVHYFQTLEPTAKMARRHPTE